MNLQYPLDDSHIAFKKVQIIKQKNGKILLVGCNSNQTDYSVIIIKRAKASQTDWTLKELVTQIHGSLKQQQAELEVERNVRNLCQCETRMTEGLIGFVRFLQGYYLLYIQERDKVARIGRHKINLIKKIGIMPLFQSRSDSTSSSQDQYFSLLESYKLENCYFSYTYDMTNSLARNMTRNAVQLFQNERQHHGSFQIDHSSFSADPPIHGFCEVFQWNYHMLREFGQIVNRKKWLLPIVHGYCKQINLRARGTRFNVVIISRRSRHHAGTRYIKRGINEYGFVANFVETEQIVLNQTSSQDSKPICSSFIQVRGSAPVYWMQQPSLLVAKPAIEMIHSDPLFLSTRKHYADLVARYGRKIYCVNLMKQVENTPRESILSQQYSNAVEFINKHDLPPQDAIHYIHIDFKANLKQDKQALVDKIHLLAYFCIMKTGLFVCINSSRTDYSQYVEIQNGVIRGNCVDCLDRTNSFQQLVGQLALEIQMAKLLREEITYKTCKANQKPFKEYGALYEEMGDLISIQYGSSLAHKQKVNKTQAKRLQILTSLTRHWNNNLKDYDRQQQIDVFLGQFSSQGPLIWKVKPPITFFPHKDLRRFESWNWMQQAYDQFLQESLIDMFRRLSNSQKLNMRRINNLQTQQFGRQQLLIKLDVDVVDHLLSSKERVELLQFCVTPKLRFGKRMWKAMNPKSNHIKPIEEKLKKESVSYNQSTQDFRQEVEEIRQPIDGGQLGFINRAAPPVISKHAEMDKFIAAQVRGYLEPRDELDENQLAVIQSYVRNCTVTDEVILEDLENQRSILCDDCDVPVDYALPSSEWKEFDEKVKKGEFLQLLPENDSHFVRRKEKKKVAVLKSPIKQKVEKLQQHKAMILEEIIKKHFSHGQRVGKISLI